MTEQATHPYPEDDARRHVLELRKMLDGFILRARDDIRKIDDPKAQALLETTAEVCGGLVTAMEHYQRREPAWR